MIGQFGGHGTRLAQLAAVKDAGRALSDASSTMHPPSARARGRDRRRSVGDAAASAVVVQQYQRRQLVEVSRAATGSRPPCANRQITEEISDAGPLSGPHSWLTTPIDGWWISPRQIVNPSALNPIWPATTNKTRLTPPNGGDWSGREKFRAVSVRRRTKCLLQSRSTNLFSGQSPPLSCGSRTHGPRKPSTFGQQPTRVSTTTNNYDDHQQL